MRKCDRDRIDDAATLGFIKECPFGLSCQPASNELMLIVAPSERRVRVGRPGCWGSGSPDSIGVFGVISAAGDGSPGGPAAEEAAAEECALKGSVSVDAPSAEAGDFTSSI